VAYDVAAADGALLLTASSQVGTPGVRAVEQGAKGEPGGASMAAGAHAAVSVAVDGRDASGLVWAATPGNEGFEITLAARRYVLLRGGKVPSGRWDGAIAAGQASLFDLPEGPKRVRLTAGPGVVAALVDGQRRTQSVHWQDGKAFVESLETDASQIALFATEAGSARVALDTIPLREGAEAPLSLGAPYERAQAEAGILRLRVAATGDGTNLHVRGADDDSLFIGAQGQVLRGRDLVVPSAGGTLLVPHGPGWVLGWLDAKGDDGSAIWGKLEDRESAPARPPTVLALNGAARLLKLPGEGPRMLHLRSASALVTRLTREGVPPEVAVHAPATVYDAYLPSGPATLALRALGGGSLAGTAELTATDVTPIAEGPGPEALLGPGGARLFSFKVGRKGSVGVGARASAEVVETVLMNDRGEHIGQGAAQMVELMPGTYLLSLRTPADAPPVLAQPVVVGLVQPDTGPPEDVIQKYVAPDVPAEFTSARAEEQQPDQSWRESYRTGNETTERAPGAEWEPPTYESEPEYSEGTEMSEEPTEGEGQ
jgi:hypothetical protein